MEDQRRPGGLRPELAAFAAAAAGLLGAAALPAAAQLSEPEPAVVEVNGSPTKLAGAVREAKETSRVKLYVREGTLISLPRPAASVLVATPGIASFQLPAPDKIFFFGQAVGATTFYALDDAGQTIAAIGVTVEHNLEKLKSEIARAVPNARIELEPSLSNKMIVRGTVRTAIDARRVVELVEGYLAAQASGPAQGGEGGEFFREFRRIGERRCESRHQSAQG